MNKAQSSENDEHQSSTADIPRGRPIRSPIVIPFLRVRNSGFSSGQFIVSNAARYLYEHLLKTWLWIHVDNGTAPSKTEVIYDPSPRQLYSDVDKAQLEFLVNFEMMFVSSILRRNSNLGSIIHHSLILDVDFDKRLQSASAAVGALENKLTNKHIYLKVERRI
jgi:hypothetical protein